MNLGIALSVWKEILLEIKNNLGNTIQPKIYVYGSRVKGGARLYSDIDILLQAQSYDTVSLRKIDFSKLDIPYKVDFVLDKDLFEGYKKEIYGHMLEVGLDDK